MDEIIARETVMRGYAGENGGERTQPERAMIGDCDVMLAANGLVSRM